MLLRLLLLLLLMLNRNSQPLSAGEHIIIITTTTTFMQSIYNYILETTHVSRVNSAAAVLHLPFVQHVMIFHIVNMFCPFTLVLSRVCVQCPIRMCFVVT